MRRWHPGTQALREIRTLPEDNGTLYPKGSLFVVNKIVVICTNVKDVKDCKNTCIVVICTNVEDVEDI